MANKYVVWFNEVDKEDIPSVGGKGANLGEMTKAGLPVPNGFIVTAQTYFKFLEEAGIRHKIQELLTSLDVNSSDQLERVASQVQKLIIRSPFPEEISREIISAYLKLGGRLFKYPRVAVRSSATAEDLPTASFAGQQTTFLNVEGEANLIEKIREAWASLFTARAIFYRATNGFEHLKVGIAVPVQLMIESEKSGVMFTIDPVTNVKTTIIIEAIYGLGEMLVQGAVTPDHYVVDKNTQEIMSKTVNVQEKKLSRQKGQNILQNLTQTIGGRPKLTDDEIKKLAILGKKIENHYYFPQDIEWAVYRNEIYILQTRPVTTTQANLKLSQRIIGKPQELLLKGNPASPGIGSGPVKILTSPKNINKISKGDILVAQQTNPDFVPAMRKAAAIVTERGGRTSHAAIVSRELGIPAVVGASRALSILKDTQVITVDGSTGEIFQGRILSSSPSSVTGLPGKNKSVKTATKIYLNLADPSRLPALAKTKVDGIGLLRAEFMIADIGIHPRKLIADGKADIFIKNLSRQLEIFCDAFNPRPVVYRTTDFKTNEYRNLIGGKIYEPEEPNPMLGFRGAARYIANAEVFEMELKAVKFVRQKKGYRNLWLMLPFVRTPEELLEVKKIIASVGLLRSPSFKLWMMVEIPTNVIRLNDFLDIGIDGVSIGSNDLTMLILGTDRDNSDVAHDFSEKDPAVLWALERVIKTCLARGVTSSICGQAPSDYPDLVEKLIAWGITSVSVNPDAAENVRQNIYLAEQKLVSKAKNVI